MRKAVLAAAALAATVTAAPALAAEFSYGGFMRYRYITGQPGTAGFGFTEPDSSVGFMEYRIRQFFNLEVNEHVTTNVKFEWNSFFGDQGGLSGASGDLQIPDETELRIKNAFVRFDLPAAPLTFTVGQQDFSTPKAIVSVEDYTGVKATIEAFGGSHDLFWARLQDDSFETAADDADWFGFVPSFEAAGVTIAPHLSYLKSHGGTARLQDVEVWYLGVDTSGKLGAVGFTGDLVFQVGDFTNGPGTVGITPPCVTGTCDVFSYIVDASVTLGAGPGTLTAKLLYSPGDDSATDGDADSWQDMVSTDLGWSPLFHDGASISNFAGSLVPGPANGGCICVGLEFALSPIRDFTVTPNVYYLMAAEDVNAAGGGPTRLDDFYGVEAGVQANWRLWEAVDVLAQFDYLFAGDVFEDVNGNTDDTWRFIIGPSISW